MMFDADSSASVFRPADGGVVDATLMTILVIDDDPTVNRLIQRSLEGEARVLQEFGMPEPGSIEFEGVDLVVLDYQMPVRDGFDVLAEIREVDPDLPVIFLTGFGDPEIAEKALRMGAKKFLTKPVGPSVIRGAVREVTRDSETGRSRVGHHANDRRSARFDESFVPAEVSREFRAIASDGEILEGYVIRFRSQTAVVELEQPAEAVAGRELQQISFKFGRQRVTAAEGFIAGCDPLSTGTVEARVVIPDVWNVVEEETASRGEAAGLEGSHSEAGEGENGGGAVFAVETMLRSRERRELPVEFRLAVHELAAFLGEVRQNAARFARDLDRRDELDRLRAETRYVVDTAATLSDTFWELMSGFEGASETIEDRSELVERCKPFVRRELYPLILCSPFLARIVERPIGVPGDYGMLGQILGNPLEGHALYDRIINSWILNSGAARAYRYRVNLLEREIRRSVERCGASGAETKVLSMASGVAYEVQHYIQDPEPDHRVDFTLVDFSTDTLEEARRQYATLGRLPESVRLGLYRSSVVDLANRSRGLPAAATGDFEPDSQYDHIYCAGLFDYLSDRLITRVTRYLHSLLAPGGKLVVSNYTPGNPLKGLMTLVLDWELIYRTDEQFSELVRKAVPDAPVEIEEDDDRAEIYAIIGN